MDDLYRAGGIYSVMHELNRRNLIDTNCMTVAEKTIGELLPGHEVKNNDVIHHIDSPYSEQGGLAVLYGNLAPMGCVVKAAAVCPGVMKHTGRARVFNSMEDATQAILNDKIVAGDKKLYLRLSKDFSVLPFDDVLAECLETAKKYYSCYPLLFQLGTLLINHAAQASNSEQVTQIMEKALEWCHRVRTEADEPNLQKEALLMESFCLLQLQRPAEAIDILEPVEMQAGSPEPLLASAYRMTGNDQEAKKILQAGIYKEIMVLLDLFPSYLNLCLNDTEQFAEACERFYRIADIFQMKTLHPSILFGVYITIAQDWMALGNTEQALDVLMQYTELAVSDIYPLHLHGDKFFNLLDEWLEGELVLGSFPPRDETLIRHSITQALSENPAFLPLANNPRFQAMVDRLRANEEGK